MFKLSNESMTSFGHGLEVAFGSARETVRFYTPDVLESASRPVDAFSVSAALPAPANEVTIAFGPSAVNG